MDHDHGGDFEAERERLNDLVMKYAGQGIKRFYGLDGQVSLVLRCDDCIRYHIIRCHEEGVSDAEIEEAMAIGLVVGGSITIPHLRRAFEAWDGLKEDRNGG